MHKVTRYHDISTGHRVSGHESKCRHLHGHNYRVHFTCVMDGAGLDTLGRVIDFGVIKEKLCMWIEDNWDHKFLHWEEDTLIQTFIKSLEGEFIDLGATTFTPGIEDCAMGLDSFVALPFNPTAENMAEYLVNTIGPAQLAGTGVKLVEVLIEETAKCHASYGVCP